MKYKLVTLRGPWELEQEAEVVQITSAEEDRPNGICWVQEIQYEGGVVICLEKKPAELVMEIDHTLWIGSYDFLPPERLLWRCKIEMNEEVEQKEVVGVQ